MTMMDIMAILSGLITTGSAIVIYLAIVAHWGWPW
jgi:hypothetical protein